MFNLSSKFRRWLFYLSYKKTLKNNKANIDDTVTVGEGSIVDVQVYDLLDNRQLDKLMRSTSKLNKKEFKVDLRYKTSRFKRLNYIRPQFDHTSTATLADIESKGGSLISAPHISWTQINNDEA